MRGLRERYKNSHRATPTGIWPAEGHERVARAHVRFFTKHCAHHEQWTLKMSKTMCYLRYQPLFCRGLQSTAPATKSEPEASEAQHLPHGTTIMSKIQNDDSFTKRYFRTFQSASMFTKHCTCHAKWFSPTPANALATRTECHGCRADEKVPESCTCHAKRRSRPQNAPDAPATRNGHSSKNEHGAVVKRDLRRSQNLYSPRSCASLHGRHVHGHLTRKLYARN